jgi:hypothetical protein
MRRLFYRWKALSIRCAVNGLFFTLSFFLFVPWLHLRPFEDLTSCSEMHSSLSSQSALPLPCVWRLYLMLLISQCWTLLVALVCYFVEMETLCVRPVTISYVCCLYPVMFVWLCSCIFSHHCLVCCLCSVSFFQPPVSVQLIDQTEYFSMFWLFKIYPYLSHSCVWDFHIYVDD